MSMDYKSSVYSYRRDPSGRRNEGQTSYGRMNDWQRSEDVFQSSFLANKRRPLWHPTYMASRDTPDIWQGIKSRNVIEVMQAEGRRHVFMFHEPLPLEQQQNSQKAECVGIDGAQDRFVQHILGPQRSPLANALLSPKLRPKRKAMEQQSSFFLQDFSQKKGPLDLNVLSGTDMPPLPEKRLTRSQTMTIERENWSVIR